MRDDARDLALAPRRQNANRIARTDLTASDQPGKAAEILIRPVDPLHRHAESAAHLSVIVDLDSFQMLD